MNCEFNLNTFVFLTICETKQGFDDIMNTTLGTCDGHFSQFSSSMLTMLIVPHLPEVNVVKFANFLLVVLNPCHMWDSCVRV